MNKDKYYNLAAVRCYFLAHEYHNEEIKNYVKNTYFNYIFSIFDMKTVYDEDDKIVITEEDYIKISSHIKPLVKSYHKEAKIHDIILSEKATIIKNKNNEYILKRYTRNFAKNNTPKGCNNILKKVETYKKHIKNLKHIHSFNMVLSFDFEYSSLSKEGVSEIGISIYYPKLKTFLHRHFLIEGKERSIGRKSNLQKSFNFGETETISKENVFSYLDDLISETDILLAHDIINECQILNIKPEWSKIIDTKICELVINPQDKYLSLKDCLRNRGMTHSYLHNAGNDSAYSLHLALNMHNEIMTAS